MKQTSVDRLVAALIEVVQTRVEELNTQYRAQEDILRQCAADDGYITEAVSNVDFYAHTVMDQIPRALKRTNEMHMAICGEMNNLAQKFEHDYSLAISSITDAPSPQSEPIVKKRKLVKNMARIISSA